jgi:hypothetical protein
MNFIPGPGWYVLKLIPSQHWSKFPFLAVISKNYKYLILTIKSGSVTPNLTCPRFNIDPNKRPHTRRGRS